MYKQISRAMNLTVCFLFTHLAFSLSLNISCMNLVIVSEFIITNIVQWNNLLAVFIGIIKQTCLSSKDYCWLFKHHTAVFKDLRAVKYCILQTFGNWEWSFCKLQGTTEEERLHRKRNFKWEISFPIEPWWGKFKFAVKYSGNPTLSFFSQTLGHTCNVLSLPWRFNGQIINIIYRTIL